MGPGESENRDRVIIPAKIQAGGRQILLQSAAQRFQRAGFQALNEDVTADKSVLAVEVLGAAHGSE